MKKTMDYPVIFKINRSIRIGLNDYQIRIKAFREWAWQMVVDDNNGKVPLCFDCGKELDKDDQWSLLMDNSGIMFVCNDHALERMQLMDTWEKILPRCILRK